MRVPNITDVASMILAMRMDPEATWNKYFVERFAERNNLKLQVMALQDERDKIRKDYGALWAGYQRMEKIFQEKQLLMWKYAERVKKDEEGRVVHSQNDTVFGDWLHKNDELAVEDSMTADEVDHLWTEHLRIKQADEDTTIAPDQASVDDEEEERGRSRMSRLLQQLGDDVKKTTSNESIVELSVSGSLKRVSSEISEMKLDPSAVSLISTRCGWIVLMLKQGTIRAISYSQSLVRDVVLTTA